MKKWLISAFMVLLLVSTFATGADAASTGVTLDGADRVPVRSADLYISPGKTLHVYVRTEYYSMFPVSYAVYSNTGKFVTSGTVYPGRYTSYPRGVAVGRYYIKLTCPSGSGQGCEAYGRISD